MPYQPQLEINYLEYRSSKIHSYKDVDYHRDPCRSHLDVPEFLIIILLYHQFLLSNGHDIILSNHRCHGHYLARTDDIEGLLLKIQGHPNGICKGRGGSQHLYKNGFLTNGIQGNLFPVAVGMAFKQKQIGKKN